MERSLDIVWFPIKRSSDILQSNFLWRDLRISYSLIPMKKSMTSYSLVSFEKVLGHGTVWFTMIYCEEANNILPSDFLWQSLATSYSLISHEQVLLLGLLAFHWKHFAKDILQCPEGRKWVNACKPAVHWSSVFYLILSRHCDYVKRKETITAWTGVWTCCLSIPDTVPASFSHDCIVRKLYCMHA